MSDQADIGIGDRLIDRIPLIGTAFEYRRRAMFGAERGVAAIMLEMVGKAGDRPGGDEIARLSMLDDACAAGGAGGHDRQPTRHGFKGHIAEGFGDRRIEEDVARCQRVGEIRAALKADETGVGQPRFKPFARRPFADHDDLVGHAAPLEHVDGVGEDVEPLFHHEPAEKGDRGHIVANTERPAPRHVPPAGIEDPLLDPARPDADVVIHPLVAQHLRKAFGGCDQRVALAVELAQPGDDDGFEERQVVIAEIGLEARVHRAGDR